VGFGAHGSIRSQDYPRYGTTGCRSQEEESEKKGKELKAHDHQKNINSEKLKAEKARNKAVLKEKNQKEKEAKFFMKLQEIKAVPKGKKKHNV
jgi:hypothetical protein